MSLRKFLAPISRKKEKDGSQSKEGVFVIERRKHPRFSVELTLDFSFANTKEMRGGTVADASEGGLLVYLHEKMEIGTLLEIEILFVKGFQMGSIKAVAKVVWSNLAARESWGEYRYGLQFQSFLEGGLERLKILLKEVGKPYD